MPSVTTRLYVIGDKESGIAFVTLSPLRAAFLSKREIQDYAATTRQDFDAAFGEVAGAIQHFVLARDSRDMPANVREVWQGIGELIKTGTTISDADFCFVTDLKDRWFEATRIPYPVIKDALDHLATGQKDFHPIVLNVPEA